MSKKSINITNLKSHLGGFLFVLFFILFAFSSCEKEDRHLDWRFINVQWFEQQRARLCEETGEKFWTETESGLLFREINRGIGDNSFESFPGEGSMVLINYVGRFFNGVEFDSRPPNNPHLGHLLSFVPGFQEALRMMRRNAIYEIIIPYKLGYDDERWGVVPPYSMLHFEIGMHNFFSER